MWKASSLRLAFAPRGGHHGPLSRYQKAKAPRPKLTNTRVSVIDALESAPAGEANPIGTRNSNSSSSSSSLATAPDASSSSPYIQQSSFGAAFQQHHHRLQAHAATTTTTTAASFGNPTSAPAPLAPSSLAEMRGQQAALRRAYDFADKHHRIRMKKDKAVYAREVQAFRAAHGGRRPTRAEVSRHTDVSLPPVAALNAMAHLDAGTSPMHKQVQDSLLLQQSVTKSELMKSNERTLVRCLSCFHVYGARPRELWGGEDNSAHEGSGQQSWIVLERERKRLAETERLMRNPKLRKKLYSVGRRRTQEHSSPTHCPKCGSPRAQWAMEYVHYRTHAR